ncbi:uncharacterized protein TrAtP1_003965 [Trichoderma atroviride]|uniref:uncharacterized protein n=1 Tax=Hypocrea atroviridis TaxID=63577 RepID=UPI00332F6098|nr:hypothetical protein TrAtP1_003965 [Trichoderma atroviride]
MQPTLSLSLSSIPSLLAADLPSRWRWSLVWTGSRVPGSIGHWIIDLVACQGGRAPVQLWAASLGRMSI